MFDIVIEILLDLVRETVVVFGEKLIVIPDFARLPLHCETKIFQWCLKIDDTLMCDTLTH